MKDRICLKCGKEYNSWERNKDNNYHPNCRGKCNNCICKEDPNMFIFEHTEEYNENRTKKV